jgi:hypothetical protein
LKIGRLKDGIEVDVEGNKRVICTVFILLEEVEEGTPAGSLAPDADAIEHRQEIPTEAISAFPKADGIDFLAQYVETASEQGSVEEIRKA